MDALDDKDVNEITITSSSFDLTTEEVYEEIEQCVYNLGYTPFIMDISSDYHYAIVVSWV